MSDSPTPETFGFPPDWVLRRWRMLRCQSCWEAVGISQSWTISPPGKRWHLDLIGEGYMGMISDKEVSYRQLLTRLGIELLEPPMLTTPCLLPGFEGTEHRLYAWRHLDNDS